MVNIYLLFGRLPIVCSTGKFWLSRTGKRHRVDGPAFISDGGKREWRQNDILHRDDGPAIEWDNGNQVWYQNGLRHRTDGPAMIIDGDRFWYQYDHLHRVDGPSIEYANPVGEYWYLNGLLHRLDGPAAVRYGIYWWYKDGMLHRDDGPATETVNGDRKWYQNGKLHRLDGPAIEKNDGTGLWYFESYPVPSEFIMKASARIRQRRAKTHKFIMDCLLSKLYDPRSKTGARRLQEGLRGSRLGNAFGSSPSLRP